MLPLINDRAHACYVEAFAGSAAILFERTPAKIYVLIDTYGELVRLYRVVANHLDEVVRHFHWSQDQSRDVPVGTAAERR
ncbi:DNA adenine methylase [Stenotrophomonas sp. JAG2]|uniref:DNA adenine methylase n=1 Tax=Stenotrophomonas sp. JAG2 TaxID=3229243 RepID=UPI0034E26BE7